MMTQTAIPQQKYKWPDCEPYSELDRSSFCTINNIPYKKAEVSPGKWQWVVNDAAVKSEADWQRRQADLLWALQTRALTDAELRQVMNYGSSILTRPGGAYYQNEIDLRFDRLLLNQALLRIATERVGVS